MPSVYSVIDILVLTSLNEGTPVALIEAMAAGIPVIATDVGGVRDLLGTEEECIDGFQRMQNGILIPSDNSAVLARALIFLSENMGVSAKMAHHAREFVFDHFSMKILVKQMESLYQNLGASALRSGAAADTVDSL